MLSIGIIGAGIISKSHVEASLSMKDVKVTCIADIVYEKAENFEKEYGIKAYTDYKEMIRIEKPKAVIIALPHKLHRDCAVYCAQQGIHLLMEKPLATTLEDCSDIIRAAEKNSCKLMVGHIQRYYPENRKAKELIDSGELGKLVMVVDIRNNYYFSEDRPKWFFDPIMAGGGIFMNYGAHSLDKIMWLTNSEVKSITGKAGRQQEGYAIEGNVQAMVEMENGVTAVISQCGYPGDIRNETHLYFTGGTLRLCTGKGLWISYGGEYEKVEAVYEITPFEAQLREFADSILFNTESPIPGEYGRDIIEKIVTVTKE